MSSVLRSKISLYGEAAIVGFTVGNDISDRKTDDLPHQMKIFNIVIP